MPFHKVSSSLVSEGMSFHENSSSRVRWLLALPMCSGLGNVFSTYSNLKYNMIHYLLLKIPNSFIDLITVKCK